MLDDDIALFHSEGDDDWYWYCWLGGGGGGGNILGDSWYSKWDLVGLLGDKEAVGDEGVWGVKTGGETSEE